VASKQEILTDRKQKQDPSGETPEKKIGSSTIEEQVSNESVPDASITPNIQVLDEQQVKAGSTNRVKKFENPLLRKYTPRVA
jgi:hypothetical protein